MVQIQSFRGLRYDLMRVGSLSDVVAPPYDVIDPQLQKKLYDRHPKNVVRLILNRREPGDSENAVYERAAQSLQDWKRDGSLTADKTAAIYVYHQEFTHEGVAYVRQGFMARVRLEPFGSGQIFPHEQTHANVKEDRLRLTKACRTNLSQIFGIYPDGNNDVQKLLEKSLNDPTPLEATDHLGVVHKIWQVTHEPTIARVVSLMGDRPIYVADGHHRYETACNYRDHIATQRTVDAEDPVNFVLMMCIGIEDSGLIVLPTHRLFRGVPPIDSLDLQKRLGSAFEFIQLGKSASTACATWEEIQESDDPSSLGLYTAKDDTWTLAQITDQGRELMRSLAESHSEDWQSLGVSILHELIMKNLLGLNELPTPRYAHSIDEVIEDLLRGDSTGRDATGQIGSSEPFQLAALVQPATVDDIRRISSHGERMPAKSTYFYPKLLCGLVFNPLE